VGAVTGTSKTVSVTSNTTFTLTATNDAGSTTQTTSVSVGVGADTTPPTIISIDPPDGATGVKSDANIVITFSEKMDQVATQNAYQSDTMPADKYLTFSWNAEGTILTINPSGLTYKRGPDPATTVANKFSFMLGTGAKDSAGNALASVSSSFATLRRIQTRLPVIPELCAVAYSNNTSFSGAIALPRVGDSLTDSNASVVARGFYTFDLSAIPNSVTTADIDFAELSIYKNSVIGTPYAFGSINLDHVNYGATTDNSSGGIFNTSSLANLGIFDDVSKPVGYRPADVKSAIGDDLSNRASRGSRSQYRLAFPGTSNNNDNKQDFVFFMVSLTDQDAYIVISYVIP
jgi:Bacterial Ig-like domain